MKARTKRRFSSTVPSVTASGLLCTLGVWLTAGWFGRRTYVEARKMLSDLRAERAPA